jgi:NAD(P)-dependent dehydrogenase (short-subunit alcohol dehydrogenase family)
MSDGSREVAFITGAGSGIGASAAGRLAARGAVVALFDLSEDGAQRTAVDIRRAGGEALVLQGDVSDDVAVGRAVSAAVERLGPLATVVACAGVEMPGTVPELDLEDWRRALDINLTGVFLTARHTIPHLVERGGGAFTAVSSDVGFRGSEGEAAYSAAKHGVVGLVRCLAVDHGPQGVRANAVCPGFVATPMTDRIFAGSPEEHRAFYASSIPLGRFARADEVAQAIAHLTSDEASYTNGLLYVVDGGAAAGFFAGARNPASRVGRGDEPPDAV